MRMCLEQPADFDAFLGCAASRGEALQLRSIDRIRLGNGSSVRFRRELLEELEQGVGFIFHFSG